MEKYWIIVDGKPQGPFTAEQLKLRRDFTAELPVWTTGMADWSTVGQVAELAALLDEAEAEPALRQEPEIQPQSEPQPTVNPVQNGLGRAFAASRWVSPTEKINGEKMPPSYLGWNIAMTLCCCLPMGIAGIFFSSMVSQKWQRGDIEGAKKASERAAWCLILSIVLGLVGWPFQMLYQMNSLSGL